MRIQCSQTGESHFQKLADGRLDWEQVERVFQAQILELEDEGAPPLYRRGQLAGLTRHTYQANDVLLVSVTKRGEHESTAVG